MEATVSKFYKALMERMKEEIETLKHFDWWNEQTNVEEDELDFDFPAIFVEIDPVEWESLGMGRLQAPASFSLHCVSHNILERDMLQDAELIDEALEPINLGSAVIKSLHGRTLPGFGSIKYTGLRTDHNHDQLEDPVHTFAIRMVEDAAQKQLVQRGVSLKKSLHWLPKND